MPGTNLASVNLKRADLVQAEDRAFRAYYDAVWSPTGTLEQRREAFETAMEALEAVLDHDRANRGK